MNGTKEREEAASKTDKRATLSVETFVTVTLHAPGVDVGGCGQSRSFQAATLNEALSKARKWANERSIKIVL